jgi:hypothetical protein
MFIVLTVPNRLQVFIQNISMRFLVIKDIFEEGRNVELNFEWLCDLPLQDVLVHSSVMFSWRSSLFVEFAQYALQYTSYELALDWNQSTWAT